MITMAIKSSSALILLHSSKGMGGAKVIRSTSGGLSASISHQLDYNGRQGKWELKGGCEREITNDDLLLITNSDLSRELDYVARLGDFAEKGKGKMIDCTYWGQNGPLTRQEIERDLTDCGGCYLKSVLTVNREDAPQLNLTSKEDFQCLMRTVWSDSVLKWGITDNPNDIHWFANFHTDQPNNLHIHITTYFSPGVFEEEKAGWMVTAKATRDQKAVIYRDAYKPITNELNIEKDYIRAYLIAQMKVELGITLPKEEIDRLSYKQQNVTYPYRTPQRTLTNEQLDKLAVKIEKLETLYQEGYGKIANNYQLKAQAREIFDDLRKLNPNINDAWGRYNAILHIYADRNGLAVHDRFLDPQDLDKNDATRYALLERNKFIREQMDDLKNRITNPLIKGLIREEQVQEQTRAIVREMIPKNVIEASLELKRNSLGLTREEATNCSKLAMQINESKNYQERERLLNEYSRIIVNSSVVTNLANETLLKYQKDMAEQQTQSDNQAKVFKDALEQYIKCEIILNSKNFINPMEHTMYQQIETAQTRDKQEINFIFKEVEYNSRSLGLTMDKQNELENAISTITRIVKATPEIAYIRNNNELLKQEEKIVHIIVKSPTVQQKLNRTVENITKDFSIPKQTIQSELTNRVSNHIRLAISSRVTDMHMNIHQEPSQQRQQEMKQTKQEQTGFTLTNTIGIMATIALVVDIASKALMRDSLAQDRSRKREQKLERYITYGEREIER